MSEEDYGRRSMFNAGVAMTERIDALQRAMNSARFNPTASNFETGKFNYEIMVAAQDGLLIEAWSKLKQGERELGDRIHNLIHNFIERYPIIMNINGEIKINKTNLKTFMEIVNIYEKRNKIFLDDHNLNNPDKDDDDGL